jgi:hypothetical protein
MAMRRIIILALCLWAVGAASYLTYWLMWERQPIGVVRIR